VRPFVAIPRLIDVVRAAWLSFGAAGLFAFSASAATPPPASAPLDEQYRSAAARLIGAALSSDHAWQRMSELCDGIGHRLSGSPSLERAVRWAEAAMKEDGLERVRLQRARVPVWVRGEERAEMILPRRQPLSMLGLGRSIGTPAGGIAADVVVATSFASLAAMPDSAIRGRIVLWDVPFTTYGETVAYRSRGAVVAARRGAIASLVRSVGPVSLRTPHTGNMSAYSDTVPKIPAAAVTIEDATMIRRLLERGERVRIHLAMNAQTLPDTISHNVIGEIRGRTKPDEVVVVGGHLDSWDVGTGAHDDGGGCVISMEALRLIKQLGLRPQRTIRCVLWTNEENGTRGATAYADSLGDAVRGHVAAIESDGGVETPVGFGFRAFLPGTEKTDSVRTQLATTRAAEIARLLEAVGANRVRSDGGGADITPLMKKGVLGIAHQTTMAHYFDWHHTESDMLDKVDPITLRQNVAAMAVLLYVLADMPEPLAGPTPVTPQAPSESMPATR
jgi:carboxypeptidase Q